MFVKNQSKTGGNICSKYAKSFLFFFKLSTKRKVILTSIFHYMPFFSVSFAELLHVYRNLWNKLKLSFDFIFNNYPIILTTNSIVN